MRHESKCRHLHGHNFVFFLTAEAFGQSDSDGEPVLQDDLGRVIDFGVLKSKLGSWIETNWDHGMVLYGRDSAALSAMAVFSGAETEQSPPARCSLPCWHAEDAPCSCVCHLPHEPFTQKIYVLPYNPTAENLAKHLLEIVGPQVLVGTNVRLTKVQVFETENGIAEASLEPVIHNKVELHLPENWREEILESFRNALRSGKVVL